MLPQKYFFDFNFSNMSENAFHEEDNKEKEDEQETSFCISLQSSEGDDDQSVQNEVTRPVLNQSQIVDLSASPRAHPNVVHFEYFAGLQIQNFANSVSKTSENGLRFEECYQKSQFEKYNHKPPLGEGLVFYYILFVFTAIHV